MSGAIEPTSFIVVAVFIVTILGVAYGLKTRKGSGISEHPDSDSQDPARDPSVAGSGTQPEFKRADSTLLDQHMLKRDRNSGVSILGIKVISGSGGRLNRQSVRHGLRR